MELWKNGIDLGGLGSDLKLEDQNSVGVAETVISCAHSWSSFSGRLTRVMTGYFFIRAASKGAKQPLTAEGFLVLGSNQSS
jgi:hypothetical protein